MQRAAAFVAVAAIAILGGCTSYSARQVRIMSPDQYPARAEVGDISIGAIMLDTEELWRQQFDTAPAFERGYEAVNIVVFNDSDEAVTVDPNDAMCQTAQADIAPADPAGVAESVLRSTTGRFIAGGILAAGSSSSANEQIRSDFVNKVFPGRVRAGGTASGFVYCANASPVTGVSLRVQTRSGDSDVDLVFPR